MKLTKKQAKELSIKKWEYIVNHDGNDDGLIEKHQELIELKFNCGYCELYMKNKFDGLKTCGKCPLITIKYDNMLFGCVQDNHPWNIWYENQTKENAQAVLDLIKNS